MDGTKIYTLKYYKGIPLVIDRASNRNFMQEFPLTFDLDLFYKEVQLIFYNKEIHFQNTNDICIFHTFFCIFTFFAIASYLRLDK